MATKKITKTEETKPKSNPNGANQHDADPRQALFLSYYHDPKSDTFANGMQSALKAGYSQEYAENILSLMPKWLSENIGDSYLISKAEENLKEFLEMSGKKKVEIGGIEVEVDDPALFKIKQDTTKFTLERLGKNKYSTKTEIEGNLKVESNLSEQQLDQLIRARAKRSNS